MNISGVSTAAVQQSLTTVSGARAAESVGDGQSSQKTCSVGNACNEKQQDRDVGIFRQEVRAATRTHLRARFAAEHPVYSRMRQAQCADEVAEEALGAARSEARESPTSAAKSIIKFRASIRETASYLRETAEPQNDLGEIENAVAKIDDGLEAIGKEVAANRESSATVLAVESQLRQRSTIRIRTQEGDVVKLSLRHAENISAVDISSSDGSTSSTSTEIAVSSRSRLMLRVHGDLNDNELSAIRNVFAQAEQIANDFFGGDIGAAFNLAEGFEFDSEQLARVRMNFRMRQTSDVSYTETTTSPPAIASTVPLTTLPDSAAVNPDANVTPAVDDPTPVVEPEPKVADVVEAAPVDTTPVADTDDRAATELAPHPFALSGFLESLSSFLRSLNESFSASSSGGNFNFLYSESFKLELLSSVFTAVAPDDSAVAARGAGQIIDSIAEDAASALQGN